MGRCLDGWVLGFARIHGTGYHFWCMVGNVSRLGYVFLKRRRDRSVIVHESRIILGTRSVLEQPFVQVGFPHPYTYCPATRF